MNLKKIMTMNFDDVENEIEEENFNLDKYKD